MSIFIVCIADVSLDLISLLKLVALAHGFITKSKCSRKNIGYFQRTLADIKSFGEFNNLFVDCNHSFFLFYLSFGGLGWHFILGGYSSQCR